MITQIIEIIKIITGSLFVLFLPGFFLSFIFMKGSTVDLLERLAISFALSISVVPLIVFYINILGVPINFLSVSLEICGIVIFAIIYLYVRNIYSIKNNDER